MKANTDTLQKQEEEKAVLQEYFLYQVQERLQLIKETLMSILVLRL